MNVIGATGSRHGVSDAQRAWVYDQFESGSITAVHHGACTGADEFVHEVALENGVRVEVWPPVSLKYLSALSTVTHLLVTVHQPMPYLNRDREIVRAGQSGLIALPRQDQQPPQEAWGGTWYTVNFAQRLGRDVVICYPNGNVERRVAR